MSERRTVRFPRHAGTRLVEGGSYIDYREGVRRRWTELAAADREMIRDERRRAMARAFGP